MTDAERLRLARIIDELADENQRISSYSSMPRDAAESARKRESDFRAIAVLLRVPAECPHQPVCNKTTVELLARIQTIADERDAARRAPPVPEGWAEHIRSVRAAAN